MSVAEVISEMKQKHGGKWIEESLATEMGIQPWQIRWDGVNAPEGSIYTDSKYSVGDKFEDRFAHPGYICVVIHKGEDIIAAKTNRRVI